MFVVIQLFAVLLKWSSRIRRSRVTVALAAVAGVVAGLANAALLGTINRILMSDSSGIIIWVFIALCIFVPISGFVSQALLARLTAEASYELRMRLCRQILVTPYRLLEQLGIPRLLVVLTEDVPAVTTAIANLALLTTHFAIIAGCLLYLAWLSWPLLVWLLGAMAVGILGYQLATRRAMHYFHLMREEWDVTYKAIRGLTEGIKELKLNRDRREDFVFRQLEPPIRAIRRHAIAGNTVVLAAGNAGQILFFIFIGVILSVGPHLLMTTHRTLTGFTLTVLFMIAPLNAVLNAMPNLSRAYLAARKIDDLGLSLENQPTEEPAPPTQANAWRRLDLVGVTHTYLHDGLVDEFQLGPLDLTFSPGELVFLIGGNGSGKTTLAKLLLGLYEPHHGEVRLDGRVITRDCRDDYRQNLSAVFTDFYLFDQLLGLQCPDIEAKAQRYLNRLQLDHKVRIEDQKLSTIDLSQGQRKRLALLTAYLEDRSIYVFDEWAADQDPIFKRVFYCELLPELKAMGKTVIVISHDDRFYYLADRLIKLERGQLEYDRRIRDSIPEDAASPP
jgi:putative ATP-binding cassette transporter